MKIYMSVCANIFVLFKSAPSPARLAEIEEVISNRTSRPVEPPDSDYGRLRLFHDADLRADVSEDGTLHYLYRERAIKPTGVPSIQDRLFAISYLSRWWDEGYPEGPVMEYAVTMLCLIAQADVSGVWYMSDSDGGDFPCMSRDSVHRLIDSFIAVGEKFGGKPVKYIRSESGIVINV